MTHALPTREISYDVFLSYNNRDHAAVEAIAAGLREQGISVFLDRWYLVAGTPWPEHLESVLNSCRSAAIILGPHGTGRWQQREQYLALERQARDPAFPVIPVLLLGADPALGFLSLNTWVDLRRGIDEPGASALLAAAVRGEPPGPESRRRAATTLSTICPYRGLRFFREEDAPFLFGRDSLVELLVSAVDRHALVAVVGASGSGKSSVVRAGLVPFLRQRKRDPVWDIATMVPGDRPLHALAAVMVRLLEPEMSEVDRLREIGELAKSFETGRVRLRDAVTRALEKQPGTDRLMLVIDQWEELYTLTKDQESRQRFQDELLDATAACPLSVTLTLRGDFFDQILGYRPFSDRLQDAIVNVSRMTRDELSQAIERPAVKVGLRFESGLVNRILNEVQEQPGNLPLLEFVLTELWNEREDEVLTHTAYDTMGETRGAIATHAEKVFAALSLSEQEIARRVFLQLVRPAEGGHSSNPEGETGPTRRRTRLSEFGSESLPVIRKLADAHLLITGRHDATGEEFVDLVHEALIRAWTRLSGWIEDDRAFLAWREKLRALISISAGAENGKYALLRIELLDEAAGWLRERRPDLSLSEQRFIDASERVARSERTWLYVTVAVLVVLMFSYVVLLKELTDGDDPFGSSTGSLAEDGSGESDQQVVYPAMGPLTEAEAAARRREIQRFVGVASLDMVGTPTVAILGSPPRGTLPGSEIAVLELPAVEADTGTAMEEYVSSLVQSVRIVAPDARFLFVPMRFDTNFPADVPRAIERLPVSERPRILLAPYTFGISNAATAAMAFQAVWAQGILVVTAIPDPSELAANPALARFVTVGWVDSKGERSAFSVDGTALLGAPGEKIPVVLANGLTGYAGEGPAAAIVAGIAARILDRHPELAPSDVMDVLRATSQARAPNGLPVVNLEAALSSLSRR